MRSAESRVLQAAAIGLLLGCLQFGEVNAADMRALPGKTIAFDITKGNCLACHHMDDGESPGDLGPALMNIRQRYPDLNQLRKLLWDPLAFNPTSRMPPFGRYRILTEAEIDMLVDYLYTL